MRKIKLPDEHKLIFLCARLRLNDSAQKEIREILSHPLDWNKIIEISTRHEIMPFLYYNLNKLGLRNIIPADSCRVLKNSYFINLNRNIRFYKELSSILEATNNARIDVILLKGIHLIEFIYNNPALRIMADIDILAKEGELIKLKTILSQLGYQEILKPFSPGYIQKYQITFGFTKSIPPDLSLYLDLHRKLIPARPYKINLPQLWERAQERFLDGQKAVFLSSEDTLLFLALHLRGHMRQPLLLKSICDIAELLNLYSDILDWGYLQAMARKNRVVNNIYFALYISQELLEAPVPNEILNKFKPGWLKAGLIRLCANKYNFLKSKTSRRFILRFLIFDRNTDFLLYLWRVSFLEKFIARKDFCKILIRRIIKRNTHINADDIAKK